VSKEEEEEEKKHFYKVLCVFVFAGSKTLTCGHTLCPTLLRERHSAKHN
jgi:hypothetical protein